MEYTPAPQSRCAIARSKITFRTQADSTKNYKLSASMGPLRKVGRFEGLNRNLAWGFFHKKLGQRYLWYAPNISDSLYDATLIVSRAIVVLYH